MNVAQFHKKEDMIFLHKLKKSNKKDQIQRKRKVKLKVEGKIKIGLDIFSHLKFTFIYLNSFTF